MSSFSRESNGQLHRTNGTWLVCGAFSWIGKIFVFVILNRMLAELLTSDQVHLRISEEAWSRKGRCHAANWQWISKVAVSDVLVTDWWLDPLSDIEETDSGLTGVTNWLVLSSQSSQGSMILAQATPVSAPLASVTPARVPSGQVGPTSPSPPLIHTYCYTSTLCPSISDPREL